MSVLAFVKPTLLRRNFLPHMMRTVHEDDGNIGWILSGFSFGFVFVFDESILIKANKPNLWLLGPAIFLS